MASASSAAPQPRQTPNVARAGGIMMVSLLLSRVLGIVRDAIIAGQFGVNDMTDSFRLAFSVPDLLFFLIAGGALSSAFIPVFSEYLHTDREDEAWHIFSVVATVMSLILVVFITFAMIFSEPLAKIVAPGSYKADLIPFIAYMSRIILPAQFAFFIGGLMFGTLYARQVFAVPGLGPNVYNVGQIVGALVLSSFITPGVVGMTWGALAGAIIGNLVIPGWAMWKLGARYRFSLDIHHEGVRKVFRLMIPVVLGLSLPGVYALVMQAFATFYPHGVNTTLDFSNKLMQAPLGIFGQSLAISVFPALTQFFAEKQMDRFRGTLAGTLRSVIYMSVPVAVFMAAFALPISAAMYRQGATNMEATQNIAASLQFFCIGIPAWCVHPVIMRAFFAIQDSKTPIILGTVTTAVFLALVFSLRLTALSYLALPLSSSLSAIVLVILLTAAIIRKTGDIDLPGLLATLGKSLLASVPVGLIAAGIALSPAAGWIVGSKLAQLSAVAIVFLICAWPYYLVTRQLKMSESGSVARALDKIKSRLPGR